MFKKVSAWLLKFRLDKLRRCKSWKTWSGRKKYLIYGWISLMLVLQSHNCMCGLVVVSKLSLNLFCFTALHIGINNRSIINFTFFSQVTFIRLETAKCTLLLSSRLFPWQDDSLYACYFHFTVTLKKEKKFPLIKASWLLGTFSSGSCRKYIL